jgi:hypothetical protein
MAARIALAHPAERVRQPAEQQVLGHRQVGHVLQLLVDHRDAGADRGRRAREAYRLAVHQHAARIGLVLAAENLQQRGLARAVLAHEAMDLPAVHVERDAVECPHAGEDLADIVETQNRSQLRLHFVAGPPQHATARFHFKPLRRITLESRVNRAYFEARPISVRTMPTFARVASMPVVSVKSGGILPCVIHAYIRSEVSSPWRFGLMITVP